MLELSSKYDTANAVLHVDFAENTAIANQFENHSVHWKHEEPIFSQLMYVWASDSKSKSIRT